MSSRRTARVAQAIRETVSSSIVFELRDPRIRNITVLSAEVSGDLRNAKVHVSVMGDAKVQSLTMHGLNAARGFLQAKVADRLQTKVTPVLQFVMDSGIQKSIEASRLLRELMSEPSVVSSDAASNAEPSSSDTASGLDEDGSDVWDDEQDEVLNRDGSEFADEANHQEDASPRPQSTFAAVDQNSTAVTDDR